MSASPRLFRPCVRVILVFAHVSSMKTRRLGSRRNWIFFHKVRRRATSGRSCSPAKSVFFEADPLAAQKTPQRVAGHGDAALAQFGKKRMQRQIRLFGKTAEKKAPLAFQKIRPLAAHSPPHCLSCGPVAPISQRPPRSPQRQRPDRQLPPRATIATTRSRRSRE